MKTEIVHSYLREDKLPHIWCPGCGHGIILSSLIRAIDSLKWKKNDIALVSGIGCSSRTPGYVDFNTLHTTHGRSLPFAAGIKFAKPELNVISVMGDGDAVAIGGNHFIHAARRNIGITALIFNNNIYGMTGGQFSPTTPEYSIASTSPYGNIDTPFDIVKLAMGAEAGFVARSTAIHVPALDNIIKKALKYKGFSVVEILSFCPIQYGKRNKMKSSKLLMDWIKDITIPINKYKELSDVDKKNKIPIGIFIEKDRKEYTEHYEEFILSLAKKDHERYSYLKKCMRGRLFDL